MFKITNALHSIFVDPLVSTWSPTARPKSNSYFDLVKYGATISLKFLGRTVTLILATATAALALKILAETKLGIEIGLGAFLAAKCFILSPALLIPAIIISLIATGLLTSYLIENFVS
jgi:hypothetical protein